MICDKSRIQEVAQPILFHAPKFTCWNSTLEKIEVAERGSTLLSPLDTIVWRKGEDYHDHLHVTSNLVNH